MPSTQTIELHTRGRVRIDSSEVYTCWLHSFFSWRRLGVPFIDPRGLGAVGLHLEGNICFLSGGAPDSPVHHRTGTVHNPVQIAFLIWRSRPLKIWSRWRTGHCPVHTRQSGAPFIPLAWPRSRADCAADRWLGRPWTHRTVRCTTGQSGEL